LTAVNIKNVLPTIVSRSFLIEFGPLDFESFREITGSGDRKMYDLSGGSVTLFNLSCIQKVGAYDEEDKILFFDLLEEKQGGIYRRGLMLPFPLPILKLSLEDEVIWRGFI